MTVDPSHVALANPTVLSIGARGERSVASPTFIGAGAHIFQQIPHQHGHDGDNTENNCGADDPPEILEDQPEDHQDRKHHGQDLHAASRRLELSSASAADVTVPHRQSRVDEHARVEHPGGVECPFGGPQRRRERLRALPVVPRPMVPAHRVMMGDGRTLVAKR